MSVKPIRHFNDVLATLNRGRFTEKCDEAMAAAIEKLESLPGEKGTATITLTVALVRDGDRLEVKPAVKLKLPEDKAFSGTVFWPVSGGLSVQHPSQTDMFAGPRDIDVSTRRERDFA